MSFPNCLLNLLIIYNSFSVGQIDGWIDACLSSQVLVRYGKIPMSVQHLSSLFLVL